MAEKKLNLMKNPWLLLHPNHLHDQKFNENEQKRMIDRLEKQKKASENVKNRKTDINRK